MIRTRTRRPARSVVLPRVGVAVLALAVPVWAAAPQVAAPQIEERTVLVSVLDGDGAPVPGLAAGDFVVREDGLAREVVDVAPAPLPSHLVLLVDDSAAVEGLLLDLRQGLRTFVGAVAAASGDTPAIRLATFGARHTTLVEFTTSTTTLLERVDRIVPRVDSGATLLDAIVESTSDLAARRPDRGVIVAFVAESGPEFSHETRQNVADALRRTGTALWAVVLQARGGQDVSDAERDRAIVLGDTVADSGGLTRVVLSREGIDAGFRAIASALVDRYAVTYARPDTLIPPSSLDVSVRQTASTVVAPVWP